MADKDDSLENVTAEDMELSKLFKDIAAGPHRKELLRVMKQHNPAQPIPELDTEEAMLKFAAPQIKRVADLEAQILRDRVERSVIEKRDSLREQGYSKDDIDAIEKLMVAEKIPSYDTAAKHYSMSKQLATPSPASIMQGQTNTLPVDKKQIKEAGGIKNWSRLEAHKAADDIRSGRVKFH